MFDDKQLTDKMTECIEQLEKIHGDAGIMICVAKPDASEQGVFIIIKVNGEGFVPLYLKALRDYLVNNEPGELNKQLNLKHGDIH